MNNKLSKTDLIFSILGVLVLLFIIIKPFDFNQVNQNTANVVIASQAQELQEKTNSNKILVNPFDNIVISAKAAIVFDVKNDSPFFQLNSETVRPLASLTKLMTSLVVLNYLHSTTTITIHKSDLSPEGDSGLYVGEEWKLNQLLEFTLMTSSNDGASALASNTGMILNKHNKPDIGRRQFITLMNKKSQEWGMYQSYFLNPSGLDLANDKSGAYGTALDLAKLMSRFMKTYPVELYSTGYLEKTYISESGFEHLAKNTNQSLNELPVILGSKTGFTDLAGGNLVLLFDAGLNRPIVVVVLGSTLKGRFTDATTLAKATIDYLKYNEETKI